MSVFGRGETAFSLSVARSAKSKAQRAHVSVIRRASVSRAVLILALALPAAAWAWPVTKVVAVKVGGLHFEHAALSWVDSENPAVATAELLASGEVLITGVKPGHTHVLFYGQGRATVWRIDVTGKTKHADEMPAPDETSAAASAGALEDAAKKACPDFAVQVGDAGARTLSVTLGSATCRKALLALFRTDAFQTDEVSLTFTLESLQQQLRDLGAAFAKISPDVKAHYLGAGLVLEGEVTPEQHRQILWAAFRHSVGPLDLEDDLRILRPASSDGGTP